MHSSNLPTSPTLTKTLSAKVSQWLIRYVLPAGWLALLTGFFWIGDRSLYHKLYYGLLAAPTLIALACRPKQLKFVLTQPLLISYVFFAIYISLSIFWTTSDSQAQSLLKRPVYVLLLLSSAALLGSAYPNRLLQILKVSSIIAVISAALSYGYFFYSSPGGHGQRFGGYGALYNPLLTAHVFGFFATFWLVSWFINHKVWAPAPLACLAMLGIAILATGSRTPLLALSVTAIWLCVACGGRKSWLAILAGGLIALTLFYLHPAAITARGLSHRPDIWIEALKMAKEQLLFGYGYDHMLTLETQDNIQAFNDPHNIELAVLLAGGVVGLALWTTLYAIALIYSWRNRSNNSALIASALLVFGLAAGLTEGRDFLSRPKEHWFLIWIPFALILHTQCSRKPTP